jgi:hypothetical protein
MGSTQAGDWTSVSVVSDMALRRVKHIRPPPTTMTLGAGMLLCCLWGAEDSRIARMSGLRMIKKIHRER